VDQLIGELMQLFSNTLRLLTRWLYNLGLVKETTSGRGPPHFSGPKPKAQHSETHRNERPASPAKLSRM